jgi:hypothetical protein
MGNSGGSLGSPNGFHNIEPRTREERAAANSVAQKMRELGSRNPASPVAGGAHHVNELERFKKVDVAAENKMMREEALKKKELTYQQKQEQNYQRDKANWDRVIAAEEKKETMLAKKREMGGSNTSGQHYNIMTLDYRDTPQGQALKAKDEMLTSQAAMRSYNLYSKGNSGINILTHEPQVFPTVKGNF